MITTGIVLQALAQPSHMAHSVLQEPIFLQTLEGRSPLLAVPPVQLQSTALLVVWLEPVLQATSAGAELHRRLHQHRHLHFSRIISILQLRWELILAPLDTSVLQALPSSRSVQVAFTHIVRELARRRNARHAKAATTASKDRMNQSSVLMVTTALLGLKAQ